MTHDLRKAQTLVRDWLTAHGTVLDPMMAADLVSRVAALSTPADPPSVERETLPPDWKQDQAETSRIRPVSPAAKVDAGVREKIARIIEPYTFWSRPARDEAFAKTDAILAALSHPVESVGKGSDHAAGAEK